MQRIEDCPVDCDLAEITPIRNLPGKFRACAQLCETSTLKIQVIVRRIAYVFSSRKLFPVFRAVALV